MSDRKILYIGVGVSIKLISVFLLYKYMAKTLTIEEFGIVSQFMMVIAFINLVSGFGSSGSIIKCVKECEDYKLEWLKCGLWISYFVSTILLVVGMLYSDEIIDNLFLGSYINQLIALVGLQFLIGWVTLNVAYKSATKDSNFASTVSIFASVIGVTIQIIFGYNFGANGLVWGLVLQATVIPAVVLILSKREPITLPAFDKTKIKLLSLNSLQALSGGVSLTLFPLLSRNYYAEKFGWTETSYWIASLRISDILMTFLGMYILHFFYANSSKVLLYKTIGFASVSVVLYYIFAISFEDFIIKLMYTEKFLGATIYLKFQFVGDLARVLCCSISAYLFIIGKLKICIMFEMLQGVLQYLLLFPISNLFSVGAGSVAYATTYILLLVILFYAFKRSESSLYCH